MGRDRRDRVADLIWSRPCSGNALDDRGKQRARVPRVGEIHPRGAALLVRGAVAELDLLEQDRDEAEPQDIQAHVPGLQGRSVGDQRPKSRVRLGVNLPSATIILYLLIFYIEVLGHHYYYIIIP